MNEDQAFAYKLAMQGATQAQIDQVFALKAQIQAVRQSLPLYERMKKQLRFIRGGFGQVGHQVQDIGTAARRHGRHDRIRSAGFADCLLFGPGGAAIGALLAVGVRPHLLYLRTLNSLPIR